MSNIWHKREFFRIDVLEDGSNAWKHYSGHATLKSAIGFVRELGWQEDERKNKYRIVQVKEKVIR